MEEKGQQGKDRLSPASISALPLHGGDGLVPDNFMDKPISPKNKRIVSPDAAAMAGCMRNVSNQSEAGVAQTSVNPSNVFAPPDQTYFYGAMEGSMRNISSQSEASNAIGAQTTLNPSNIFPPQDQTYFYGASGYDDGSANWGDYSNYVHANNLQIVPPAMYNDNSSVLFHPAYGFDGQVAYGQVGSPLSPIIIDGQLFSPHQFPMSPNYFNSQQQSLSPTPPNSNQESFGYYMPYASYGGPNSSPNNNNNNNNNHLGFYKYPGDGESLPNRSMSTDTGALYPSPLGLLGSYDNIFGQIPQQQTTYGYGGSSTRRYPQSGFSGGYNYGEASRFVPDKGGKHRERDAISATTSDRNRGPRASKPKGNNNNNSDVGDGKNEMNSSVDVEHYNRPDFVTTYDKAKFFVIKSFSEDNVHKSIKYGVWASTPLGNRKLDAAYQESKESNATCPVFLFFSVNASGQFCGVAEMVGAVDFVNDAEYWQQDRWSGQFKVKWHIVKDVPNSRFRHIILQNNDNKPVTHSRDSQEVKLEAGMTMLKIFKDHEADTSILDDFSYYDEREKDLTEKRSKERDFTNNMNGTSITQLADKVADSLHVEQQ